MSFPLSCTVCKKPYVGPTDEYVCTYCGGSIEPRVAVSLERNDLIDAVRKGSEDGIWGYRLFFPVEEGVEPLTLGEGNTPLLKAKQLGCAFGLDRLLIKNETLNPTGTYKDRFATVALSIERAAGTRAVALGSAGNAAAAVSAYSAVAGIPCFVLLPPGAVQERAWQNQAYGAMFIRAEGEINDCIDMVVCGQKEFGWKNLCTTMLHNPYGCEGYKSIAYEMAHQMDFHVPDWIICPVGGGILLSKIYRGYTEMLALDLVDRLPRMVGVQAEGCAPLVKAFKTGEKSTEIWENPKTIAFAINDACTFEGVTALFVIRESGGLAESVNDDEILSAMRLAARTEAILAEPASASTFAAAKKLTDRGDITKDDLVVCIATGSALRDLNLFADDGRRLPLVRRGNLEDLGHAIEVYGGMPC